MDFPRFLRVMERRALFEERPPYWPLGLLDEFGLEVPRCPLEQVRWQGEVSLDRAATDTRRTLLFGAARAARAGLDARAPQDQGEPRCDVDLETARAAFRGAIAASPLRLELVLAAFVPTVIVYPEGAALLEPESLWFSERAGPHDWVKGLLLLGEQAGEHQRRAAGEAHFLPPVRRGELARRRDWVEANDIDPPLRQGWGGPFRRLGESELWRLGMLGWREKLVLAGALSTRIPVCAVVCGPAALPRVGYVVQKLRLCRRTIVHVPWDALPVEFQDRLLATRFVHLAGTDRLECGKELP